MGCNIQTISLMVNYEDSKKLLFLEEQKNEKTY